MVVGKVRFEEDGDIIDCTKMGTGGKAIPANTDKVFRHKTNVRYIGIYCFYYWLLDNFTRLVNPTIIGLPSNIMQCLDKGLL